MKTKIATCYEPLKEVGADALVTQSFNQTLNPVIDISATKERSEI